MDVSLAPRPVSRVAAPRTALGTLRQILFYLLLTAFALAWMVPFIWMVSTALKPEPEIYLFPPKLIPSTLVWANFVKAMKAAAFPIYFRNSLVQAVVHTVASVFFGAMAGYAFARLKFRGHKPMFLLLLAKMMVPSQVTLIPLFLLCKNMPLFGGNDMLGHGGTGWLNSWWGLLVPGAISAYSIFMFRQFFQSLPRELEEAARIDGASEWRIFWGIMLPQATPAVATLSIFAFQSGWNSFLWPLVITTKDQMRTIQIGLTVFRQDFNVQWAYLMAATTLATIPMILIFLFGQRYFVKGITMTGMKG